jgi:hypothetical protein
LEFELVNVPQIFLRGGFRILIAECLEPNDQLYYYAAQGWQQLKTRLRQLPGVESSIVQIRSVEQLNETLSKQAYDIMILRGHGQHDAVRNISGIIIGGQLCLGLELIHLPRLVILSACDVMPRGTGALNIADIMLLRGAVAVLGTLIPVDVQRNASLMFRLFAVMVEAINGQLELRTLEEAWRGVHSSNVAADILYASPRLLQWGFLDWHRIAEQYIQWENEGRIRNQHLYRDTEALLADCAKQRGLEKLLDKVLCDSYFPETLFYMFTGRPDRIILRDDLLEDARRKIKTFDLLGNRLRPG